MPDKLQSSVQIEVILIMLSYHSYHAFLEIPQWLRW